MLKRNGRSTADFVPATGWHSILPFYDPLVALFTSERRIKSHLVQCCKDLPRQAIIDVGCGSGTFLKRMREAGSGNALTGVDPDPHILKQAQQKLAHLDGVMLLQGKAEALPFEDESFDIVVNSLMLHHLEPSQKQDAAMEFYRVLKPGGTLLVADFGQGKTWMMKRLFLIVRLVDGWSRTQCHVDGKLPDMLTDAGFAFVTETLTTSTLLGTIQCLRSVKPT